MYVFPMPPGDIEGRLKYLFRTENEPLAEVRAFKQTFSGPAVCCELNEALSYGACC